MKIDSLLYQSTKVLIKKFFNLLICKPAILENMISSLLQYSTYVATFIYSPIRLLLFICLSLATKNVFLKNCKLLRMNMIMRHRKYMNMKNVWGWSFFFDVLVIYDICINTKISLQWGSNSRPLVYKTSALTTELWRR